MWNLDWKRRDIMAGATVIETLDLHTAGEPLRIVTSGLPELAGKTILERRRYMWANLDHVRRTIMHEPRGHFNMYGAIVTPPVSGEAHVGVLFTHNEGYSTMCGHGVIALVTALLETGAMEPTGPETPVTIDAPAGLVRAVGHVSDAGRVERVSFLSVPSFVYRRGLSVEVPGVGRLVLDLAYGGAFYAILPAAEVGLHVEPAYRRELVDCADAIRQAVNDAVTVEHPYEPDLGFLYGVILTDRPDDPAHHSRNICVFADREVDRSPTGTGVSARLALGYAKGELDVGQRVEIESVLGRHSVFTGEVVEPTRFGPYPAVVPRVTGQAFITGRSTFILHPQDRLGAGFLV